MVTQETLGEVSPENLNIRVADPAELMRDNPAALIVNKISYEQMGGRFSPNQFEPVQVVRVVTYSSEHGRVTSDFVLDGMTRTKFVNDNKNDPKVIPPGFQFTIKDVTDDVLQNPAFIPVGERAIGQKALTMLQYLRAVIPPTIVHSEIAPDRIAAHLINGWENMVGEDIAKKYSALAALSLLGNQRINIATNEGLGRDLDRQRKLMAGETFDERTILRRSLLEMAAVIRETKLNRQEIARSAYMMVGADSPVIGGEKEAKRQIYGLLHTPEVNKKLEDAFSDASEREQMRDQLGQSIADVLRQLNLTHNKEEVINVLGQALGDPVLNLSQVTGIFTSDNPIRQYDLVREDANADRLTKAYQAAQKVSRLSETETALIDSLGRRTNLSDDMQSLIRTIKVADTVSQRVGQLKLRLELQRDQLIETGVRTQTINEAISAIESVENEARAVSSLEALARFNQRRVVKIDEINGGIDRELSIHKVGLMIDQATGDRLKTGYGPRIRTDIVGLVIGDLHVVNEANQSLAVRRVRELTSLDEDLLSRVKSGDISLTAALQRQRDKRVQPVQPVPPVAPLRPAEPVAETPPAVEKVAHRVPPRVDEYVVSVPQPEIVDKGVLNEQRVQNNILKLSRFLKRLTDDLTDVDLKPEEVTDELRFLLDTAIRQLGYWDFNNPDTPRVMRLHPQELAEINRLRAALLERDREVTDRDTRTGR